MSFHVSKKAPFIHRTKKPESLLERIERRKRRWLYVTVVVFGAFTFLVLGLLFALRTYTIYAEDLVSKERLLNRHFRGLIIYDKDNSVIYESEGAHEVGTVKISEVTRELKNATLAIEDANFYEHTGFSWTGILRSVTLNFQSSNAYAYGGSTITQQLVKNALLDDRSKSYVRKIKELILAVGVDRRYSKDQILEMYLNTSYYGRGAYSVGEAAKSYFGTTVDKLSLAQSAYLAGLPNAPSVFAANPESAKKRQLFVLQRMYEERFITESDLESAKNEQLAFAEREIVRGKYPHFSLYVRQRIISTFGENALEQSGFRVFTTLDSRAQDLAQSEVVKQVAELQKNKAGNAAAVVLNPKNGAIVAMVGSADWDNDAIDGKVNVVLTPQQPGSSFKPIIYTRALERGLITSATQLKDSPTTFPGNYSPKNYDGKFRGPVTVRRALANSLNLPAVEIMEKVGVVDAVQFANKLGIKSLGDPSNYGLSLVLGGGEVTPMEMTAAYATLANSGVYNEPYAIEKILDKYGQTIYTHMHNPQRVIDENAVYITTHILSDNTARQEIFGPTSLKLTSGRPAAVKTGTTDEYRDAWTIGYTPNLAVGVWVGNNNNAPMDSVAGSLGAAPIWKGIVDGVSKDTPFVQFARPAGVVEGEMCKLVERTVIDNGQEKKFYEFTSIKEVYIRGAQDSNCNAVRKQVEDLQRGQEIIPSLESSIEKEVTRSQIQLERQLARAQEQFEKARNKLSDKRKNKSND